MVKSCVVFVSDKAYFHKFVDTCSQLVSQGNYTGDICLVIGDDLVHDECLNCEVLQQNRVLVKYFPNFSYSPYFLLIQEILNREPHWYLKQFQYHKLYLFHTFFKQWDYLLYLDCGIHIFADMAPIWKETKENTLLAHSDAFPTFEWKLHTQFVKNNHVFEKLQQTYNLNMDYFQTTMMLYDTSIIEENTLSELTQLLTEYPISVTNDQGIIALYFTQIKPRFQQIKTHNDETNFYDYGRRNNHPYILLKVPF